MNPKPGAYQHQQPDEYRIAPRGYCKEASDYDIQEANVSPPQGRTPSQFHAPPPYEDAIQQ